MVAAAGCAIASAPARAATYDVWSCRGPDGAALATSAWQPIASAQVKDTCAAGGSLTLSDAGALRLTPPDGTRIAGYELWRSLSVVRDGEAAVFELVGSWPYVVDGCPLTRGCRSEGDPTQPLSAANRIVAQHAPLDGVVLAVGCDWECDTASAQIDLYRAHVTIADAAAPTVSGTAPAGDDALVVSAADRGGGVAAVTLAVDGGAAQTNASACHTPYTAVAPCPPQVERAFSLAGVAAGAHSAAGTVVDAAGNATPWGPVAFTVTTSSTTITTPLAFAGNGTPAVETPVLRLADTSVRHAAGAATQLHGTLKTARGAPIAGAQLSVSSFDLATDDAVPRALSPVTTDAAGAFTVTLRRDGAQRVTVAFSPHPGVDPTASATATVRTRLALALGSSRGRLVKGRLLTLSGRLRGAGPSAAGTVVAIESIVNGRWQPVGATHVRADGRYRWSYRFVHLQRDTIFSFRAVVERSPGWPWFSQRSAAVRVRVDVP